MVPDAPAVIEPVEEVEPVEPVENPDIEVVTPDDPEPTPADEPAVEPVVEPDPEPVTPMVLKKPRKEKEPKPEGALLDGLLATPQARELMKEIVLETLRSPEGQALIRRALK